MSTISVCTFTKLSGIFDLLYRLCVLLLTGEDDLRDVRSAVADLAGRWKDLGVSLGVRSSRLDEISSNSPSNCLREMLALWLRQSYNVRTTLMLCPLCLNYYSSFVD